ncbi:uncharacterized protein KY384_004299 [Bacidia gigantensis]|uniref:uncharacterized protein n=1 Tax=Bacidia gigantensis TaxID=2732470 RepID=UPI001D05753A|nr:uncharacterized protein KY384_004299 [Bacidia gigantensis]KAG8530942.1 hypothetical protein KY384_004299 [Bacidia gigantensis]
MLSLQSWVMLDGASKEFVRLPRERVLITSPSRTSLALQTPNSYPGKEPLSIKCSDGRAFVTTQRLVYLPTSPTSQFQSLSVPILALQDTHVTAPFFGPNVWEGIFAPTAGGGFSTHHHVVQIKITFREGGAFDYQSAFEQIKEQVTHAAEIARESGRANRSGAAPIDVDLEQLPAYEGPGTSSTASQPVTSSSFQSVPQLQRPTPISSDGVTRATLPSYNGEDMASRLEPSTAEPLPQPDEPPPGYDEAQSQSVADRLESNLREQESRAK